MKKTIFAFFLAAAAVLFMSQANSGEEIIKRARAASVAGGNMSTRSRMVITAKSGATSELVLDQYTKDDPKGGNRTLVEFQSPARNKGTRFLLIEDASGSTNMQISLPNVGGGRARRIASGSESSGSFMGTDFSYDDISALSRAANLDTHTLVREETYAGAPCYVIESVPKDSGYLYTKRIQWVEKQTSAVRKMELYTKNGLAKVMEIDGYKNVDGHYTPHKTTMRTVSAGTFTTIFIQKVTFNTIPNGFFTQTYLETGRR